MTQTTQTREQWLNELVSIARPMFKTAGSELPENVRVSMGLPGGRKSIGECWSATASADGGREIFISPEIDSADENKMVGVLIHELCHAALPNEAGHKKPFKDLGTAMLLSGKPTCMGGDNDDFKAVWGPILEKVGAFPGITMSRGLGGTKKQVTYMRKVECMDCETVFRMTVSNMTDDMCCPCCRSSELEVS